MTTKISARQNLSESQPKVWVRQMVLFESIDPVKLLRSIDLSCGLNIIWGREGEGEQASTDTGHGVGKSTVCRLIRFCLGERSFGQKHVISEVQNTVPNAYVGAIIVVNGENWGVLKSLTSRTEIYAAPTSNIEELIQSRPKAGRSYKDFLEQLRITAVSPLHYQGSLTKGDSILWHHLLAMCSRDQETRYDRFWHWRHPRSFSESPKFSSPKSDAAICIRAILGLLNPEEQNLRQQLVMTEKQIANLKSSIQDQQLRPNYEIRKLRNELEYELGMTGAMKLEVDSNGLFGLKQSGLAYVHDVQSEINEIDAHLNDLQKQIDGLKPQLQDVQFMANQKITAKEMTQGQRAALLKKLNEIRGLPELIKQEEWRTCLYGGVSIGNCEHVRQRLADHGAELQETSKVLTEASELESDEIKLDKAIKKFESTIDSLLSTRNKLHQERTRLQHRRLLLESITQKVPRFVYEITRLEEISQGRLQDSELKELTGNLETEEIKRLIFQRN